MWSRWGRPSPTVRGASPNPTFPCSSFKDVHRLYSDDENPDKNENPNPQPAPSSGRKKVFHRVRVASSLLRHWPTRPDLLTPISPAAPPPPTVARVTLPGTETRVVVYYTSLRVIRPTFEACRTVQSILGGFRVNIDERDVTMDSGLLDEVQRILGTTREKLALPVVFVGGRYVGGAEEVRQLHEIGELKNLIERLPAAELGVCGACGGYRFLPCTECNGSHKVYSERVGFRCCTTCNENGLIKCPACYPTAFVP